MAAASALTHDILADVKVCILQSGAYVRLPRDLAALKPAAHHDAIHPTQHVHDTWQFPPGLHGAVLLSSRTGARGRPLPAEGERHASS